MSTFTVFFKKGCKACEEVLTLLNKRKAKVCKVDVTDDDQYCNSGGEGLEVPRIWHGGKFIGGEVELANYLSEREVSDL